MMLRTPAVDAAIHDYVSTDDPVRAICARHGISSRTLYDALADAGLSRRSDTPLDKRPVRTSERSYRVEPTSLKQRAVLERLRAGTYPSLAAIAREVGVSLAYVSRLRAQWYAEPAND